jgi:uncharacterized membrane protein YhaH (DUF805 family)
MNQFIASVQGTLNKYADFKGIAGRSEYWFFFLFTLIVDVIASIGDNFVPGDALSNLLSLLLLIPSIAVAVRRMHDTDHRGWFVLVPFYNIYLLLSKSRPNRWGVGPDTFGWSPNS